MNMYGNIPGSVPPFRYMPISINDFNSVRINTAIAQIRGGYQSPQITGTVYFNSVRGGTLICAQINGLPSFQPAEDGKSPIGPHGFHIHEHGNCDMGSPEEPFAATHGHWNPTNQPHGNHVGDFPVLFSNHGYAYMCFFTDKFRVEDVIGKAVVIHQSPDDYRSQPAGDAGKRLACGVIKLVNNEMIS